MRLRSFCSLVVLAMLTLTGCQDKGTADPASGELTKVTLQLNWFPETEHGGYYHAQLAGFFADAGLEVEILKGGPNTPVEVTTGAGRADFGIVNADKVLTTRAEGVPLVGLLAPFQVSPRCIIVHESSSITSLAQLRDCTLVANHTKPFIKYLQHKYGLDNVEIVPYKGGMASFLQNPDYAIQGYATSEPLTIARNGVPNRAMLLADDGYNPYTSVLVTSETFLAENPEIVRAMVHASQQGWVAYLADPAAANQEIQRLNPEMDDETLAYGAEHLPELMLNETTLTHGFGHMTEARWTQLFDQLATFTDMADGATIEGAFTNEYLDPAIR